MQCVLQGGRVLRRVLRRGSKKGLSRRHLEGRSTPLREYDPVGVRPTTTEYFAPFKGYIVCSGNVGAHLEVVFLLLRGGVATRALQSF